MRQAIIIFIFISLSVYSQTKEIKDAITVIDFKTLGLEEHIGAQIAGAFSSKLVELDRYNVMERSQMKEILKEQAFQSSGTCDDQNCLIEVGQLLGVKYLISGEIGKLENSYTLNVKLLDVQTGKITKQKYQVFDLSLHELIATQVTPFIDELFSVQPDKIVPSEAEMKLLVGEEKKISYSVLPEGANTDIELLVQNPNIVSSTGQFRVKGKKEGIADIILKSIVKDDVTATIKVIVAETDRMKTEKVTHKKELKRKGLKIALASGSGLLAVGGAAYYYLNQQMINTKQNEYDSARDFDTATELGNQMYSKAVQRNIGMAVCAVAAVATVAITIFF